MIHLSTFGENNDGWPTVTCVCGFAPPPLPDMETAADVWGEHMYAVARGEAVFQGDHAQIARWLLEKSPDDETTYVVYGAD